MSDYVIHLILTQAFSLVFSEVLGRKLPTGYDWTGYQNHFRGVRMLYHIKATFMDFRNESCVAENPTQSAAAHSSPHTPCKQEQANATNCADDTARKESSSPDELDLGN